MKFKFIKNCFVLSTLLILSSCTKLLPSNALGKGGAVLLASANKNYTITAVSGGGQNGVAGNTLSSPFIAVIKDSSGNLAQGITVHWNVTAGGGSFSSTNSSSDTSGQVAAFLTLGSAVGVNTATATIGTTTQVASFSSTGAVGTVSAANSSIVGSSPIENDGINSSTITITLKDVNGNFIVGTVPTFSASGSSNIYGTCTSTNSSGVSTCSLKSTTAETKILSLQTPSVFSGGTVVFAPGAVYGPYSTITGTGPVTANGVASSVITITLVDSNHVGVGGVAPTFSATDTLSTNGYGTCSLTDASGVSTCALSSSVAELKTLSITSPISFLSASTVNFVHGSASSLHSTITGTSPIEPDGISTSLISIVLKDASGNPISGTTPTFSATDTGATNAYGACSVTDAAGLSTCHLSSTTAETKTLSLTSPISFVGGSVVFAPSAAAAANSSISGTSSILADGIATSTITITLKDINNVAVGGVVPTFSATDTASKNISGVCTSSSATTGISTCTLASSHAEIKTLSLVSPIALTGNNLTFYAGPFSSATSTITGTGPVVANGVSTSTVTVTLLDANGNPISGTVPTYNATDTGAKNAYNVCSSSNASGVSTCTFTSTKAEVKSLSIVTPGSVTGGNVTFTAGAPSIATSTVVGTGPVASDGVSTSTITITLLDAFSNPVIGTVPTFSATNTGATNVYGACSLTNASGVSTCTLASSHAETKTLSLLTPIAKTGGTVVFAPGSPSTAFSTITGSGPVTADGFSVSTVTITIKDAANTAIAGVTPTFTATNTGNTNNYSACTATDASGISTCSFSSTRAEVKTLSIASPISMSGGTVTFTAGAVSNTTSAITGTGPVSADGTTASTITVVLYDSHNNPISGVTPTFSATDTGSTNVYGACSATTVLGSSTCTLKSTKAETKTLSIVSPVSVSSGTVTFTAQAAVAANSTITGTGPMAADGASASTVTITLQDINHNPVAGVVPTFTATNTGNTNVYGTCTTSNVSGVSICTLKSTHTETKTLSIATPVVVTGGTVIFTAATASSVTSTITGTGPVNADGVTTSTITITLKDVNSNPIAGTVPTFTATDTGATNVYGACSSSNASGISTCTLKSTRGETKTLSLATPIAFAGGTVVFNPVASPVNSTITGTGPVIANGVATSTITITIKDYSNTAMTGIVPTFSATDTGATNSYTLCSSTNASGVSTCTMKSTKAETKTLSLLSPIAFSGGTVSFVAGAASAATSTITGSGPVNADGVTTSTITITLKDANSVAVAGTVPTFTATDTGASNVYGVCSSSNASGVSTCTLKSTRAETKTLSLATPVVVVGGTVAFNAVASPINSSITGTGPVTANGVATSTVTITIKDYSNTAMAGIVPTFSATDTGATNSYTVCSTTNASGVSTCTMKSTKAETKTLSLATPIVMSGGTVSFVAGAASATTTTITGTGPVNADGVTTSTITITILDANSNPISGTVPTFTATNTSATNVYGVCSSSNASGVSTCTLKATKAETKTLSLATPVVVTGGTVVFNQAASAAFTTITGTGSVLANNTATSTVTITLKDYTNTAIAGVIPTFTATDTSATNVYGVCSSSSAAGVSTCTLKSSKAETKTLSLATPAVVTGGTVVFTQVSSPTNSSITGTGPVNADGTTTSTVTITLKDYANVAVVGVVPTFTATNTGTTNVYGVCSSTNASGVSTCTLKSTKAETKTLSLATPIAFAGGTVIFNQLATSIYTTITGTTSIAANGVNTSTVTITLKDFSNTAIAGVVPNFTATDTGATNIYGTCSSSNASGVSTCTLKSTRAETKTLSLSTPISMTGGTVVFTQAPSLTYSSITGTGPTLSNGVATSTITITLKDYSNIAIAGLTPTFTATNTGATNVYGACSATNASGVSTCTLKSTKAETKTLSIATPIVLSGGTVVFN